VKGFDPIKSIFRLKMSDSSESDSSNRPVYVSDGEFSVASSYGSEVQDCRKRPRQPQIQGNPWVFRGHITVDELHADSDWTAAGPEGNDENEDKVTKINAYLQRLLGAQFETLFGKMHGNVKYFVIFCNLVNILDFGADTNDVKVNLVKVEIRGFLQLQKPTKLTALQKLLSPFAPALSGCWERCVGGLFGHAGYTECLRPESAWFELHHTGEFGNNNDGKHRAKARRLANKVFLGSGAFAMLCGF
jgi:hypothetical protein